MSVVGRYLAAFNAMQREFGFDVDIGARLPNLLVDAGYSDLQTRPLNPRIDKSMSPAAREEAICYWRDLYLSASEELESAERVTPRDSAGMAAALESLRDNRDGVYSYVAFQCVSFT